MRHMPTTDHVVASPAADLANHLATTADLGFIDPDTVAIAVDYMTQAAGSRARLIAAFVNEDVQAVSKWRWQLIANAARDSFGTTAERETALWSVVEAMTEHPARLIVLIHTHLEDSR